MATLTADNPRVFELQEDAVFNDIPAVAADIIYAGAAVGDNGSGYGRPLVAADPFLGFAHQQTDNSAGAAGDLYIRLRPKGYVVLNVTGVTGVGDVGDPVYASDDNTFTLTSTSNSAIGKVHRHESGTRCVVYFESVSNRSI